MFKKGDFVCLNALGKSESGLGNKGYVANFCSAKLLAGEALAVYDLIPSFEGSTRFSVRFEGGSYSFSPDYFQLA